MRMTGYDRLRWKCGYRELLWDFVVKGQLRCAILGSMILTSTIPGLIYGMIDGQLNT